MYTAMAAPLKSTPCPGSSGVDSGHLYGNGPTFTNRWVGLVSRMSARIGAGLGAATLLLLLPLLPFVLVPLLGIAVVFCLCLDGFFSRDTGEESARPSAARNSEALQQCSSIETTPQPAAGMPAPAETITPPHFGGRLDHPSGSYLWN